MKSTRIALKSSVVLGAILACSLAASAQNLVQNPSFETSDSDPNWSGGVGALDWSAATSVNQPVWNTTSVSGIPNEPPGDSGSHFVTFPTGESFDISQGVTVSTAGSYDLSFWVYAQFSDDSFLTASVGGASHTYDFNNATYDSNGNPNWVEETISGIALGTGSQTVNFSVATEDLTLSLDDVSLDQSPTAQGGAPDNASNFWLFAATAGALALLEAVRSRRFATISPFFAKKS